MRLYFFLKIFISAQNHTFDTKSRTVDTKGRGKILRFHFLIETEIFRQFWLKKCAADTEKALSHSSTFTRCIPKTAQAKGFFETETKEKNLKISINLEVLIWWTFRDSNPGPTGYEPVALTN